MRGAKRRRIVEEKVAGNTEMRHERLLGVSRLDGRKRGREGEGDTKRKEESKIKKREERGRGGWMKQIGTVEKMKLELTTNGSTQRGRDGSGEREGAGLGGSKHKTRKAKET